MASQGPNSPSTAVNDTAVGARAWSVPGRVVASDDSRAAFSTGVSYPAWHETNYLKATNFGFTIPSGATIDGILVEIEKKAAAPDSADVIVSLVIGGSVTGSNYADTSSDWPVDDTYVSYGGATSKWGLTPTADQINGTDFGVVLQGKIYKDNTSTRSGFVDHIRITVYYTEGSTPDELTSKDISSGVPTVDKSTIGQTHALTSTDVSTPAPIVDKATIAQVHALTSKDVATPAPVVDKATLVEYLDGTISIVGTSSLVVAGAVAHTTHEGTSAVVGTSSLVVVGSLTHATLEGSVAVVGTSSLTSVASVTHATIEGTIAVVGTSTLIVIGNVTETHDAICSVVGTSKLGTISLYDALLLSGAGFDELNGIYSYEGMEAGKPKYKSIHGGLTNTITWWSSKWAIWADGNLWYSSNDDVATPDLITTWYQVYTEPPPTITIYNPEHRIIAEVSHQVLEGNCSVVGSSALLGSASIAHATIEATTSVVGTSSLIVAGSVSHATLEGAVSVVGTSSLITSASVSHQTLDGTVSVVGTSTLTVIGETAGLLEGTVNAIGTSSLIVAGSVNHAIHEGTVSAVGTSSLTVAGSVAQAVIEGQVSVVGTSTMTVLGSVAHVTHSGTVNAVGTSTLMVAGAVGHAVHEGAVNVAGTSSLGVIGDVVHVTHEGAVAVAGTSWLTVGAFVQPAGVPPACRTYVIDPESRLVTIAAESRLMTVEREGRTFVVTCSDGYVSYGAQEATVSVIGTSTLIVVGQVQEAV